MSALIFFPLAGALLASLMSGATAARRVALLTMAGAFGLTLYMAFRFEPAVAGFQFVESHAWIPALGVDYLVGVDGLALVLLLLTTFVTPFALLTGGSSFSKWGVVQVLILETTLLGTFSALNFVNWFVFYEFSLVPAFFLIRSRGTAAAAAAALRLFLFTLGGGLLILAAFLAIYRTTGSFNFPTLAELGSRSMVESGIAALWGPVAPAVVILLLVAGLGVKVPVVPLHMWLPGAYAEAPPAVTMLLTGLMSKMGIFGFFRWIVPLFPTSLQALSGALLALALVTIVFSAFVALRQTDIKKVFAYSSVNHLGYCLLGLFAWAGFAGGNESFRAAALGGVVLQLFNHGLTASALFCYVSLIERRSGGTTSMADFGGLRQPAPVLAGLMGLAIFSSLGLPGLNGFVGEFLILSGTFGLVPWAALGALVGIFVTAVFLLGLIQKVFTGPLPARWQAFPDLKASEIWLVLPATALMLVLGLFPQVLLGIIQTFRPVP